MTDRDIKPDNAWDSAWESALRRIREAGEDPDAVLAAAARTIEHYRCNPPTPEQIEEGYRLAAEYEASVDDAGRPWADR